MPEELARLFDALRQRKGFENRSQAFAELVRQWVVDERARTGKGTIAGSITLVYDHHKPGLQSRLTALQHRYAGVILSVLHAHLDSCNCLEIIALRGAAQPIYRLADAVGAVKGIKHARLSVTTAGREFRHGFGHVSRHSNLHEQDPPKH